MSNSPLPGDRVERPVIFLSMVNADDQTLDQLNTLLKSSGLTMNYQFIISSQPIQMVNPMDLITQLQHIYNVMEDGDPHNTGVTRTENFRRLFTLTERLANHLNQYIETNDQNIANIADTINNWAYDSSLTSQNHVEPLSSSAPDALKANHQRLKDKAPQEGRFW